MESLGLVQSQLLQGTNFIMQTVKVQTVHRAEILLKVWRVQIRKHCKINSVHTEKMRIFQKVESELLKSIYLPTR